MDCIHYRSMVTRESKGSRVEHFCALKGKLRDTYLDCQYCKSKTTERQEAEDRWWREALQ